MSYFFSFELLMGGGVIFSNASSYILFELHDVIDSC